jgi:catabolite regulation protein CreA
MVSNKNLAFKEEKIMRWWKDSHWKDLTYLWSSSDRRNSRGKIKITNVPHVYDSEQKDLQTREK